VVLATRGGIGSNSSPSGILISGTEIKTGEGPVGLSIPGGIFSGGSSLLARYSGSLSRNVLHPEKTAIKMNSIAAQRKEIIMFFLFRSIQVGPFAIG
jgi:hypothetical protein